MYWQKNHGIVFYYLIEAKDGLYIPHNSEFVLHKDNSNVVIVRMPISELDSVTIYHELLKDWICHLENGGQRFITYSELTFLRQNIRREIVYESNGEAVTFIPRVNSNKS